MESSKQTDKNFIFDEIRKCWVRATPEEIVRQKIIQKMIFDLGFPRELLVIEKEISLLPHLQDCKGDLPNRRLDIICFTKKSDQFSPLLLVECKKEKISKKAMNQLLGYNYYVKAPFVSLVGKKQICFAQISKEGKVEKYMDSFLPYAQLIKEGA